jgi:hypothetical protein
MLLFLFFTFVGDVLIDFYSEWYQDRDGMELLPYSLYAIYSELYRNDTARVFPVDIENLVNH